MTGTRAIGLVGFGAVGRKVVEVLAAAPGYRVVLLVRQGRERLSDLPFGVTACHSLEDFLNSEIDLVLEAASATAFQLLVPRVLEAGIDVVAASAGALVSNPLVEQLMSITARSGARLVLAGGSIGGLDYILATRGVPDTQVSYISRKPFSAWKEELIAIGAWDNPDRQPVTLYEGNAADAVRRYPRNLNAGFSIALAAGVQRTRVRVIADPAVHFNTHEIEVTSAAGTAHLKFVNAPSPRNPKTSEITGLSLVAAVRRYFEPISF